MNELSEAFDGIFISKMTEAQYEALSDAQKYYISQNQHAVYVAMNQVERTGQPLTIMVTDIWTGRRALRLTPNGDRINVERAA